MNVPASAAAPSAIDKRSRVRRSTTEDGTPCEVGANAAIAVTVLERRPGIRRHIRSEDDIPVQGDLAVRTVRQSELQTALGGSTCCGSNLRSLTATPRQRPRTS